MKTKLKKTIAWILDKQWGFLLLCLIAAPWIAGMAIATFVAWQEYPQASILTAGVCLISFGEWWKNWRMRREISSLIECFKLLTVVSDANWLEHKKTEIQMGYTCGETRYSITVLRKSK